MWRALALKDGQLGFNHPVSLEALWLTKRRTRMDDFHGGLLVYADRFDPPLVVNFYRPEVLTKLRIPRAVGSGGVAPGPPPALRHIDDLPPLAIMDIHGHVGDGGVDDIIHDIDEVLNDEDADAWDPSDLSSAESVEDLPAQDLNSDGEGEHDVADEGPAVPAGWTKTPVDDLGWILFNSDRSQMSAHCRLHKCRINKVSRKRPMGYFCCWLMLCHGYSAAEYSQPDHFADRLKRQEGEPLSQSNRSDARALYEDREDLVECFRCEPPPPAGHDKEPKSDEL